MCTPPNSHVRKYSAYPQNLCTVLTQIFTNVELFTAEMHKISSNFTVNNDKLVDNFIFAVMHSPSTWSSSKVQAGACEIVNGYSLDWKIPELKHPAPKKKLLLPLQIKHPWREKVFPTDLSQSDVLIKQTSGLLHIYIATFFCVGKTGWILRHQSCCSDLLGAS